MNSRIPAQILVTSLFFLWAIAHNLNDVLIKQFQKALELDRGQAGFIQVAFYLGYFFMALPAGFVIRRWGYKRGIIFGLLLYAGGALLFYPAAEIQAYGFFLLALFIIASGLTFLETAANPYITLLGDPQGAEQRLNFAQAFNGLGAVLGPIIGGLFILSGIEYSDAEMAAMPADQLAAYRSMEAHSVQKPYLGVAGVVLLIVLLIYKTNMPEFAAEKRGKFRWTIFRRSHFVWGVVAQLSYVGAQVGIWSYFIDYMIEMSPGTAEKTAAYYLSICLFLFMTGRFIGSFLMGFIPPRRMLLACALANMVLVAYGAFGTGTSVVYAMMAVSFFMSIMFPTVFALSIKDLGDDTKIASSVLIMSVIGGALFPLIMGYVSNFDIQLAMIVPLICFGVVFYYAAVKSEP